MKTLRRTENVLLETKRRENIQDEHLKQMRHLKLTQQHSIDQIKKVEAVEVSAGFFYPARMCLTNSV